VKWASLLGSLAVVTRFDNNNKKKIEATATSAAKATATATATLISIATTTTDNNIYPHLQNYSNLMWLKLSATSTTLNKIARDCIFSHEQPFYERAVSDLDPWRYMHRPVKVAHSSVIEWSHTTKNTASVQ
jgi:hypothetical protein